MSDFGRKGKRWENFFCVKNKKRPLPGTLKEMFDGGGEARGLDRVGLR